MSAPAPRRRGVYRLVTLAGARALAAGLGLLATLQLAPAAGPAVLGQWAMLLAVQGWALHLAECGLRSVVTAEAGATAGGAHRLLPAYLATRLLLASAVTAVALAAAAWLAPAQIPALALVLSSLFAIALQLDWLALVEDRPLAAGALLLVRPAAWCLLLALVGAPVDVDRLAALFALAWALAASASWPLLLRTPRAAPPAGQAPLPPRRMLALGIPLALVTLSNQGLLAGDLVLVGLVLGAERAGTYYLANALVVAALVLANAANQIATARIGALRGDPEAARRELARQLRAALAAGLALALAGALAAPPLVAMVFGPAFAETASVFVALLPWLALQHPSAVLQGALAGARGQRALLLGNLVMTGALALGLAPALATGSTIGCALARALAEAARLVVLARAARRIFAATQREPVAARPAIATLAAAARGSGD